jgi:hypothetical protein
MKKVTLLLFITIIIALAGQAVAIETNDGSTKEVNIAAFKKVMETGHKLPMDKSFKLQMVWKENTPVKELDALIGDIKIVALYKVLFLINQNEKVIFDKIETNSYQFAASILNRVEALSNFKELVGNSELELDIKEYLDNELADLISLQSSNLSQDEYTKARKIRSEKLLSKLSANEDFNKIYSINTNNEQQNQLITNVANLTSWLAYTKVCMAHKEDICVKL